MHGDMDWRVLVQNFQLLFSPFSRAGLVGLMVSMATVEVPLY
jgi:hypothetical protein